MGTDVSAPLKKSLGLFGGCAWGMLRKREFSEILSSQYGSIRGLGIILICILRELINFIPKV